jgi:hypothetical protein
VANDPDQVIGGIHWDIGELATDLRLVPNFEIGLGDDHTILVLNAPVHYLFRDVDAGFTPFAGGGVALGWVDRDNGKNDDSDFEVALKGIGGVEWTMKSGTAFFVELDLVIGDLHDFQVLAGWTFRTRR